MHLKIIILLFSIIFSTKSSISIASNSVAEIICQQYMEKQDCSEENEETINAYLRSIDKYAHYYPANTLTDKSEKKISLGVKIQYHKNKLVLKPYMNSPSYNDGIKKSYYLKSVNGQKVTDLEQVKYNIEKASSHSIKLTLQDLITLKEKVFTVYPSLYKQPDFDINYIRGLTLITFYDFRRKQTRNRLYSKLRENTNVPIILDFRYALGGDLYEALDLTSLFVKNDKHLITLIDIKDQSSIKISSYNKDKQIHYNKLIILTSHSTASASEIIISALKKYSISIILGEKTYGKCTSQIQINLPDNSKLRLTNKKIIWANNIYCNGKGINPDIKINEKYIFSDKYTRDKVIDYL